jgi:anti-sigma factor RsiW
MTCLEVQKLLNAYMDGELDLVHNLEIERHLQDCVACQTTNQNNLILRKALKSEALYYKTPAGLQKRLRANLRKAAARQTAPAGKLWTRPRLVLAGLIGALAVLLAVGGLAIMLNTFSGDNERLAQEVVASHIRSLMLNHLSDVASTDQHTVKPWFDGKLDFSPVVEDFASKGYPLVGGRLDYLDKQPVAALVYQRAKHIINLFSWPDDRPDLKEALQTATLQGYHLIHWVQGGSNYWAVSDLNESELTAFVQLLESAIGG